MTEQTATPKQTETVHATETFRFRPTAGEAGPTTKGILEAMWNGIVIPHKRDEELLRYYAAKLDEALKLEGRRCPVDAASCNLRRLFERDHLAYGKTESTVHNGPCVPQKIYNIAEMLKALEEAAHVCGEAAASDDFRPFIIWRIDFERAARMAREALDAPARPCDKYDFAVDAMAELKRRHHECAEEGHPCREDCPDCGKEKCAMVWLMTPEEGGAE